MEVTSLGYQTDLALLRLGGSQVEDRGDHLVVRTLHNPSFWWGNFLLLEAAPPAPDAIHWQQVFAREFPNAEHMALGFDGVNGSVSDLAGFDALGLNVEESAVMTARAVHPPARPNLAADYRRLVSDEDWARQVDLRVACKDDDLDAGPYRKFSAAKAATMRALTDAGHGAWFGAFVDAELLSSMGLFTTHTGLARFQSVETHPAARGRGLAGTLVHFVSTFGFSELGAHTLVMVADPDYPAIRIYRSVGFVESETQLQAERRPQPATRR